MARRKGVFTSGGYYHIYNRGANRESIFQTLDNYLFLLRRLKEQVVECQVCLIAYCLMPNHYHFLLRQEGDKSISQFMQAVFNSYTKAYNKAFRRSGTLFEGPFQAIAVDNPAYLLHLCRYIHRNPLTAGLITDLTDWPYSNYLDWIDKRRGSLFDAAFVKAHFPTPRAYEAFVLEASVPIEMAQGLKKLTFE